MKRDEKAETQTYCKMCGSETISDPLIPYGWGEGVVGYGIGLSRGEEGGREESSCCCME